MVNTLQIDDDSKEEKRKRTRKEREREGRILNKSQKGIQSHCGGGCRTVISTPDLSLHPVKKEDYE